MSTKENTAEFRLSHWAHVIHDRTEKGLTIRAYCESTGIHRNTYFYWQRKLRETACSGLKMSAGMTEEKLPVPTGWAALSSGEQAARSESLTVEAGGCRITVCADTDTELLAKVCRALKTL